MRRDNYFLLLLIFTIVPTYAFGESDNSDDNPTQTDILGWVLVPFGVLVGGLVGYFIKRTFVKQDVQFQEQIEHEHWLLQQFNKLAETHYFPLAKFSKDAGTNIEKASISHEEKAIKISYYHFGIFLKKYFEFKKSTGANFLFRNRETETKAIQKFGGVLIGLPFDDFELKNMLEDMFAQGDKFNDSCFSKNEFTIFNNWITTDNCTRSRSLVIEKLKNLAQLLDAGSEEISHPELYRTNLKKENSIAQDHDEIFWILYLSKKTAKSGDTLIVFGNGFKNPYVTFDFFIGNMLFLRVINKTDRYIELKIPERLASGIYDVYANFKVERWYKPQEDTIGIPLKIVNP